MNNGTFNKKFLVNATPSIKSTKSTNGIRIGSLKNKIGGINSESILKKNKDAIDKEEKDIKPLEKEEIHIKERSPYMYNRKTFNKKSSFNNESEVRSSDKIKCNCNYADITQQLEKEIKQLKLKVLEQDKIIKDKNNRIYEVEKENDNLQLENVLLKNKVEKLKSKIRPMVDLDNNGAMLVSSNQLGRMMMLINNMNDVFSQNIPQEDEIIDQICPNPDNMTYEQLLELEEKMGYVNKGLAPEEIKKIPLITFSKNNYRNKHFTNQCTICQCDYTQDEKIKQLKCMHTYHPSCIEEWLHNNKVCPICKEEVIQ